MSEQYTKEQITSLTEKAVLELLEAAKLDAGDILVVGCSSSEVKEQAIGSASSEDIGSWIFQSLQNVLQPRGIYLAAQCCEHLTVPGFRGRLQRNMVFQILTVPLPEVRIGSFC